MAPGSYLQASSTKLYVSFNVGPSVTTVKYTLTTMSAIFNLLSAVGGVTALTILVISTILKPYQEFHLKNSLIRSFYSVDRSNLGSQINTADNRKLPALAEMLSNRRAYTFDFWTYLWADRVSCYSLRKRPLIRRAIKKRQLHDESVKRLGRELDIMSLVSEQRLSAFCHKLLMSRHQRWLVNKSQRFNLAPEDPDKMVHIQSAEAKEARTIKSGYSWRTYASIETRTDKLDLYE